MSDTKVWAYSSTGTRAHAFVQSAGLGRVRAMCRSNIERGTNAVFGGLDEMPLRCPNCEKKFNAMTDRAEASMEPATEVHDLGSVAPVDERADAELARETSTEEYPAGTQVIVSATGETGVVMNRGRGYSDIHGDSFVKIRLDRRDADGYLRYDKRYLGEITKVSAPADENAVLEAINHPVVIDALHAEAIELNEQYDKEENVAQNEARRIAGRSTTGPLNDTQHEIMKRVVQGATYQDIADERGWTRNAVADNIRVAVAKMNVPNSTAAAARYAQYLLLCDLYEEVGVLPTDAEWRQAMDLIVDRLKRILP